MSETKPSNSVAQAKESSLKAILQYAAVPLALVTSLLYLFGRVYYETYLSYWGLSESLFPLSKEQSVISGFIQSLLYSARMLPKISVIMIVLMVLMIFTIVTTYRSFVEYISRQLSRFQSKAAPVARKNVAITPVHDKLMTGISLVAGGIGLFILVLSAIVFPCKWISDQAKESARKEHLMVLANATSNKPFTSRAILYVKNDSKGFDQYSGHLIQTSTTHAALYSKASGVSIFPLSTVSQLVIHENTKVNQK